MKRFHLGDKVQVTIGKRKIYNVVAPRKVSGIITYVWKFANLYDISWSNGDVSFGFNGVYLEPYIEEK